MQIQSSRNTPSCNEEIDIFYLWGIFWSKKLFVLGLVAFCSIGGYLFATYHPKEPDCYIYSAVVEIGRYVTNGGEVQPLESPYDLVLILNSQPGGAKASVPRGSLSLIGLESVNVDRVAAKQQLDNTLNFISARHQVLSGGLSKPLLTHSGLVAKPVMSVSSVKDKRMFASVVSAIAGLLLGVFWVLATNSMRRRREEMEGG